MYLTAVRLFIYGGILVALLSFMVSAAAQTPGVGDAPEDADGPTAEAAQHQGHESHDEPEERNPAGEAAVMNSPSAPTGMQSVAGDAKVTLFWTDPGDGTITGYEYRQKAGSGSYGAWTAVPSSSATTVHYTVTGLTNGTVYKYKIRAKASSTDGAESSEVTVTPVADNTAPTVGTISHSAGASTLHGGVHYLSTGSTVTLPVPVTDPNPPSTAPTVVIKFGASGTERTLTAGTPTLSYSSSTIITGYSYTYTLRNNDVGTLRHKVTGVTDTAGTPNSMTDPVSFTEITALNALAPVTDVGLQAGSDSGADDDITNDTTAPVIEFTTINNATISGRYRKSGSSSWLSAGVTAVTTGTAGTVTLPNLTAGDGDYEVEITQQAPSAQARAMIYTFTLDTVAPTAPTAVTRTAPATATGTAGVVTVSVTADDGDTVRLYTDNTCTARTGTNEETVPTAGAATGTVSVDTGILSVAAHTIRAGAVDVAGNIACSTASASYTRTTPPLTAAPATITEADLHGATVTLTLNTGTLVAGTPNTAHFTVTPVGISGLTVASAVRSSNTVATLTLGYTGGDFDNAGSFTVTMAAAAHSGSNPYTTDPVTAAPNALDSPSVLRDVVATAGNTETTLSWTASPAAESVTGYEYRRLVPRSFTPVNGAWVHTQYRGSAVRTPSLAPRPERQNVYYTLNYSRSVQQWDHNKTMHACVWRNAVRRNANADCTEVAVTGNRYNPGEHTFRFTPTQEMINNGGVVFVMSHAGDARHTVWVPFDTQLAYGSWTAMPDGDITTSGAVKSYTVTGLTNEVSYEFKIRAVNATGNGEPAEVTVIPRGTRFSITAPAADSAVNETTGGTITVTVTAAGVTTPSGDVLCTVTPNTAGGRDGTEHADFYNTAATAAFTTSPTATASFSAGDATADCVFTINNDTNYEPDEHFTVTISPPGTGAVDGATYPPLTRSRSFSITPNDITVGLEETAVTVSESEGMIPVCAAITTPTAGTTLPAGVSIALTASTTDGTAIAGTDYTALSSATVGTLNDATRRACIEVTVVKDAVSDNGENFTLTMSGTPTWQMDINPATATVTTVDTPAPPGSFKSAWKSAGVVLSWTDPSDTTITEYQYRQCDGNGDNCTSWSAIAGSGATTTAHTVTGLNANTAYTVSIRARNANGNGPVSSATGTTGTVYDTDGDGLIDIDSLAKLNAVRYDLNGNGTVSSADEGATWTAGDDTKYATAFPNPATRMGCAEPCTGYELTANLDFDTDGDGSAGSGDTYWNAGAGWVPIDEFNATFGGNGHLVDNLFINRTADNATSNDQGLFGNLASGGVISGVGVRDADITGRNGVGALVGVMRAGSRVTTSFSTGTVTGQWAIGGLVGYNGGGSIEAGYSNMMVSGGSANVGGLVGYNLNTTGSVKNSYAYGAVSGASTNVGGLVGYNFGGATIENSYWNSDITSAAGTGTTGATGKTTAQLTSPTSYSSTAGNGVTAIYGAWDDRDIDGDGGNDSPWNFGTADQYPILISGDYTVETQRSVAVDFTATPGDAAVTLGWTASPPSSVTGWEYSHKTADAGSWGAWTAVPGSTASARSYTVPSLVNGTSYLFRVRPTVVGASAAASETAIATPDTSITAVNHDSDSDNLIDITTLAQLNAVRYDLNGDGEPDAGVSTANKAAYYIAFQSSLPGPFCTACAGYELMNDLDFDTDGDGSADSGDTYWNGGAGWVPINEFNATFGGNGYTIDNLFISRNTSNHQGLFGNLSSGGVISGVGVTNANITGRNGVAALVGVMHPGSKVTTSFSTGTVTGRWAVGGLVGYNGSGSVEAGYSGVTVSGTSENVGGLVGYNLNAGASVKNSYAYGAVSTTATTTTVGGLVGHNGNGATITDSYWDSTVTAAGGSGTAGATGKTTAQLQSPISYTSIAGNGATAIYETWDDSDIDGDSTNDAPWEFGSGTDYPTLSVFRKFTLDLDASGTYEPNTDAILLYLYTNQGSTASELASFTRGGQESTASAAIDAINAVKDQTNTPLDMDGDNTFTANTDGIIPYLYTGQGYDATALVPFTHNNQQTTADSAITLVRGTITPAWP